MRKTSFLMVFLGSFVFSSFFIIQPVHASSVFKQFSSVRTINGMEKVGQFLWCATTGGVVKYAIDAKATTLFSDFVDLPDLNLTSCVKDNSGNMWFGSNEGFLIKLNLQTEKFSSYNALQAVGWPIKSMLFFKENIFIGTTNGLSIFSPIKESMQNIRQFGTSTAADVSVIRCFGDTLAIRTSDGISYCVVSDFNTTMFSNPGIWHNVSSGDFVDIVEVKGTIAGSATPTVQRDGSLWQFGTTDGKLLRDSITFATLSSAVTCFISIDNTRYAIGTANDFFSIFNSLDKSLTQVTVNCPTNTDINSCGLDKNGFLWYMPQDPSNGFGYFDGTSWIKRTYQDDPGIGTLGMGVIGARNPLCITTQNDVFVGSNAYGVKWLNSQTKTWTTFCDRFGLMPYVNAINLNPAPYYDSPLTRFSPDSLNGWWTFSSGLCEDSAGNIWFSNNRAYNGNILHVRKPRENKWRSFSISDVSLNLLSLFAGPVAANSDKTRKRHYIYLGYNFAENMSGGGVSVLSYAFGDNPITDSIQCISSTSSHLLSVSDIAIANDTLAWLAGGDGIYSMVQNDPNTIRKITTITSQDGVYAVTVGDNGNVLFCKDRDLYSYDNTSGTLTQITKTGNLGTHVSNIVLDKKSNVYWIASQKGIFRFDKGDSTAATGGNGSIDVYPNPMSCSKFKNGHPLRFAGLYGASPSVLIYNAGGALVASLSDQNTRILSWNGKNRSGTFVVPGVYYYKAEVGNNKFAKGKIFITQ